jgi:putative transcriptional regulator
MTEFSAGKLLVADPSLNDPAFSESVILILAYGEQKGALGINLTNSPPELTKAMTDCGLDFLLKSQPEEQRVFYMGGPVEGYTNIFYIHDQETGPRESLSLGDTGFAWNVLPFLEQGIGVPADFYERQPKTAIAVICHASWEPGQIEVETAAGLWQETTISLSDLLALKPEERWEAASEAAKQRPNFSSGFPDFGGPVGGPGWMPS